MRTFSLLAGLALTAGCFNPDLGAVGFYCHPDDSPACPSGSECKQVGSDFRCVSTSGSGDMGPMSLIPKSGSFVGTKQDPKLDDAATCPDAPIEPNDSPAQAKAVPEVTVDSASTPRLKSLAICPKGKGDVDYWKVDLSGASNVSTLMADLFYEISYGDLDVGIVDETGRLLAGDGSAVTNGCVAASVTPGVYYVVVVGANNADVNRYELRARAFSTAKTCPIPGSSTPDMGQ